MSNNANLSELDLLLNKIEQVQNNKKEDNQIVDLAIGITENIPDHGPTKVIKKTNSQPSIDIESSNKWTSTNKFADIGITLGL